MGKVSRRHASIAHPHCSERPAINVPSPDTDLVESGLLDSPQLVQLLLHVMATTALAA
jgi:hypothetical protein